MPDSQKISEKQSEYMKLIAEIMDIRKRGEKPVALYQNIALPPRECGPLIVKKLPIGLLA